VSDRGDEDYFLWIHYMEAHRPYGIHDDDPAYLDAPVDEARIHDLMKRAGLEPRVDIRGRATAARRPLRFGRPVLLTAPGATGRLTQRPGVWDETNVLFSSDHGEEFGEHGLYFHRNFPYDELINVP